MEENILKYFTGNGEPTTETIKPINIKNDIISTPNYFDTHNKILVTNDKNYLIRYGGSRPNASAAIEVYNAHSLNNGEYLYSFVDQIEINNQYVILIDLKQDEDGRFYAIGYQWTITQEKYYLILLNNFIQDEELIVRKYYSQQTIGNNSTYNKIIKKVGSADYYIYSTENKIIHFKIDITSGNTTEECNIIESGQITSGTKYNNIGIIGDKLIYMEGFWNDVFEIELKKLIIDTDEELSSSYTLTVVKYEQFQITQSQLLKTATYCIDNFRFVYPIAIIDENNFKISLKICDLNGNITTFIHSNESYQKEFIDDCYVDFAENYVSCIFDSSDFRKTILFHIQNTNLVKFYETENENYTNPFIQIKTFNNYNINYLIGTIYGEDLVYFKNIYSIGYSSVPYYNNNFMIPQYLNLYAKANDLTSLVFSRDVLNRFVAGNQLTVTFNIPNYLLNNETIHREIVNGQTNLSIEDDNKPYTKNRFESLYMTYMYNMYIKDNTNDDNLINMEGSNRIANSIWQKLDYQASPCLKARITYNDINNTQSIITLNSPIISGTTATYTYQVSGDIVKIEYLSNDENTVYATYRCNLTGENTITQTIEVEEG